MKIHRKYIPILLAFCISTTIFTIPLFVHGAGDQSGIFPLVRCGNDDQHPCGFDDAVALLNRLIELLFYAGVLVTVSLLVWNSIRYITAGSSPGQLSKIRSMFGTILVGFGLMLGSWLIIDTITNLLLKDPSETGITNPLK